MAVEKDYSKGKIYRIWCISGESDDVYVGSTIQSLAKRWGGHKTHSRKETHQHYKIYQAIAGNFNAWRIELIELCPCASKMELERREGELIRQTGTLNEKIAGRTKAEYREQNRVEINKNNLNFYHNNKEKISEYYKKDAVKEKRHEYYQRDDVKERKRQYRQENRVAKNEKSRNKYHETKEANRDKFNERARLRYHRVKAEKALAQSQ